MQTLDGPVYTLSPETSLYQKKRAIKEGWPLFEQAVAEAAARLDVPASAVAYYSDTVFGLKGIDATEKHDKDLIKKVDKDGIRLFKKNSAWLKELAPLFRPFQQLLDEVSPFEMHDMFGVNNIKASQWIDDVYYVAVYWDDHIPTNHKNKGWVSPVDYSAYLRHVTEVMDRKSDT